ncbi:MAG: UvrD-helicase domain-containing protein [Anaerolineales bacterium]|nr:UvrD-helicase domain-containing protein [Anaerolineales bacterium]
MNLLSDLNSQQQQAVSADPGAVLVLAGPGSGKTRVLTYRIGHLIVDRGLDPGSILALTFTNKAAREMRNRVSSLLKEHSIPSGDRYVTLGTFHSVAARILRREAEALPVTRDFAIFDQSDQQSLVRQIMKVFKIDTKQYHPVSIHNAISSAKNEMVSADAYQAHSYFEEVVRRVYPEYERLLRVNNALDFDDLLVMLASLLRREPLVTAHYRRNYQHILVDEFQDTNMVQYQLLRLLAGESPDLFVVGDPDQSIYRWRGADHRNVERFRKDYPDAKTYLLEQNYRSTQIILDCAMGVIDRQRGRQRKQLFTERQGGDPVVLHEAYDEADEAFFVVDTITELQDKGQVSPGDCAVMYRTNAQSRVIEEAFIRSNIPYRLVGAQRFYGRREVKDLIAYLRVIYNPKDQISLERIINTPTRGIGAKSQQAFFEIAKQGKIAPGEALVQLAQDSQSPLHAVLSPRVDTLLTDFGALLADWISMREYPVHLLMNRVIANTGYQSYIDDGTEEGIGRWENIQELLSLAEEYEGLTLQEFLEHVALISDQDTLTDSQNAPTLLTLHAAKGLEFPVVFIIGLDENILPHQRSMDDPEEMAEERRLLYVGITRAMDCLFLCRAFRRRVYGSSSYCDPSRFVRDLPQQHVQGMVPGGGMPTPVSYQQQTSWNTPAPVREIEFPPGSRVRHKTFGEGMVLESRITSGDEEVTVEFADVGLKRLIASLAGLEKLND